MKKNKMMRTASALLVLVLLTTCVISGTFAKYVTTDTADDRARVAMFGVKIETDGSLFSENYLLATEEKGNTPGEASAKVSVKSSGAFGKEGSQTSNLVAPGTTNTEGLVFSVTGIPEVTVNVELRLQKDDKGYYTASDVWLGDGQYLPNMTTGEVFNDSKTGWADRSADVTVVNSSAYYPIKYTLENTKVAKVSDGTPDWENGTKLVTDQPLYEVVAKLEEISNGTETVFEAGTDLSEKFGWYRLTWKWDYTDADPEKDETTGLVNVGDNDKLDTILGNLAARDYKGNTAIQEAHDALYAASDSVFYSSAKLTDVHTVAKEAGGYNDFTKAKGVANSGTETYYNLMAILEFTITVTQVD